MNFIMKNIKYLMKTEQFKNIGKDNSELMNEILIAVVNDKDEVEV